MSDFNEDVKDIKNKASSLFDTAKENATKAYKKTKPEVDKLTAQLSDTAEDYFEEAIISVTNSIRKQPWTSVLIAAGIGYLYAKLFK